MLPPLLPRCCSCSNLTRELLDYLAVCDSEFKPDLTAKIATLIQRYAPDKRWHIDSMLQVRRHSECLQVCCTCAPGCAQPHVITSRCE
jgi:hypothetical protein